MTRQSGFRLVFSAIHKKPLKGRTRTFANETRFVGEVTLVKGHTPVCRVKFWVDVTHIYITNLDAHQWHRRCGYGRLTMDYMMFLAESLRKPIILYSYDETVQFYEKLGMKHLDSKAMSKKVRVLNENPDHKHEWSDTDFIWIPNCLKRKKVLWVYM